MFKYKLTTKKPKLYLLKAAVDLSDLENFFDALYNRSTPVPYLDLFSGELARTGNLTNTIYTLNRILKELNLGDHSLLGIIYPFRGSDVNLYAHEISDVQEPLMLMLGPPKYSGLKYRDLLDYTLRGSLKPKKVQLLFAFFDPSRQSATGFLSTPQGDSALKKSDLLETIEYTRLLPIETVPLLQPIWFLEPNLTTQQYQELLNRYEFLQALRREAGYPLAKNIRNIALLTPPERLMRILGK